MDTKYIFPIPRDKTFPVRTEWVQNSRAGSSTPGGTISVPLSPPDSSTWPDRWWWRTRQWSSKFLRDTAAARRMDKVRFKRSIRGGAQTVVASITLLRKDGRHKAPKSLFRVLYCGSGDPSFGGRFVFTLVRVHLCKIRGGRKCWGEQCKYLTLDKTVSAASLNTISRRVILSHQASPSRSSTETLLDTRSSHRHPLRPYRFGMSPPGIAQGRFLVRCRSGLRDTGTARSPRFPVHHRRTTILNR